MQRIPDLAGGSLVTTDRDPNGSVLVPDPRGDFQLEDPVSWYIPELSGMRPETKPALEGEVREMTVRDLLTHTAGLPASGRASACAYRPALG